MATITVIDENNVETVGELSDEELQYLKSYADEKRATLDYAALVLMTDNEISRFRGSVKVTE